MFLGGWVERAREVLEIDKSLSQFHDTAMLSFSWKVLPSHVFVNLPLCIVISALIPNVGSDVPLA